MKKSALARVVAKFDYLEDRIVEGDYPAEARKELYDNIDSFLKAGCDPNKVAKLLGPFGCYKQFKKLVSYGAKISIHKIAKSLSTKTFLWANLEEFVERGADINRLLDMLQYEHVYAQKDFSYGPRVGEKSIKRLFSLKADPEKVFDLFEGWMMGLLSSDVVFDELDLFAKNGLDTHFIKSWLERQLVENHGDFLDRVFRDYGCADELHKYGVDLANFVNEYVTVYGKYPEGYDFAGEDEKED